MAKKAVFWGIIGFLFVFGISTVIYYNANVQRESDVIGLDAGTTRPQVLVVHWAVVDEVEDVDEIPWLACGENDAEAVIDMLYWTNKWRQSQGKEPVQSVSDLKQIDEVFVLCPDF